MVPVAAEDPSNQKPQVDFFVSYTGADEAWAEWVAWVLEEAGFTTIVQAWDFRPGSNFVIEMQDALARSDRVMPLLSEPYLLSAFGTAEWAATFAADPTGRDGRLVGVRVGECQPRACWLRSYTSTSSASTSQEPAGGCSPGSTSDGPSPRPSRGSRPPVVPAHPGPSPAGSPPSGTSRLATPTSPAVTTSSTSCARPSAEGRRR